jgi:hypothetical protein
LHGPAVEGGEGGGGRGFDAVRYGLDLICHDRWRLRA